MKRVLDCPMSSDDVGKLRSVTTQAAQIVADIGSLDAILCVDTDGRADRLESLPIADADQIFGNGYLVVGSLFEAAVASLPQCLGIDHAHQNIRVNAVCPNEVNTPMIRTGFETRGLDPDKAIDDLNASVPLGRIAEPEDIADVVVFLASNQARYLCGALVEANGGKSVQ